MKLYDILEKNKKPGTSPETEPAPRYYTSRARPRSHYIAFWTGIAVVLLIIYGVGISYTHARITVVERKIPFSLTNQQFTLVYEADAQAGDIPFQIVKVSDQSQRQVIGTQAPFAPKKAVLVQKVKKQIIVKGKKQTVLVAVAPAPVARAPFTYELPDDQRDSITNMLSDDVYERLKRQTRTQIPDNLLLFPDLQFFFFDKSTISFTGDTVAFPVAAHGTLTSYLIDKTTLEQAIAAVVLQGESNYPEVSIPDIGALQIEPISAPPANPDDIPDSFTIAISGQGTLVTEVLPQDIQGAIAGASRSSFDSILNNFKEIDTASFTLYPFWATHFPLKKNWITVKID